MNYIIDEEKSKAIFIAYAPMHKFKGWVAKGLKGILELDTENFSIENIVASAQTQFFDTGDADKNKAMVDYFDLSTNSETSFTMTGLQGIQSVADDKYRAKILGILDFAGIRRQLPVTCVIQKQDTRIIFDISLKWSFKAYGLKRPQLLFLTVRDIVDINAHLEFVPEQEDK